MNADKRGCYTNF